MSKPPPSGTAASGTEAGPQQADDEVTETKIVGVTETGVIRKRSFKRKLTEAEKSKRYGQDKEVYSKIAERIMGERLVTGTLEGLQERLKMLTFMHEDCQDMVAQWESTRASRIKAQRQWSIQICVSAVCALLVLILFWTALSSVW